MLDVFHAAVVRLAAGVLEPGDFRSELLGRHPAPQPAGPAPG